MKNIDDLRERAKTLRLYGLLENWAQVAQEDWLGQVIKFEEVERARRSHAYRLRNAKIGNFKDLVDFDWTHPKKIERAQIQELLTLDFIKEKQNIVFVGPNGVGKTMLAKNIAQRAVTSGIATRYTSASDMLNDLASLNGSILTHRIKKYTKPQLLVIDELGYLRYDAHLADLLFEVVSRRYEREASIIVTTNKPFVEWNQVFEGAACVTTLIDRLCHRVEIVAIDGSSYRAAEAAARAKAKKRKRSARRRAA